MEKICPIIQYEVSQLGRDVLKPNKDRNYCVFNERRTNEIMAQAEHALPVVDEFLKNAKTEDEILDGLHVIDKMADKKVKGVENLYPTLSRFNDTDSPNVQVMLAGIYRKTLMPEAFGPLNKMLHKEITKPNSPFFDPTEETGGAILEYIKSYGAANTYGEQLINKSVGAQLDKVS